jgi:hypothetical protein
MSPLQRTSTDLVYKLIIEVIVYKLIIEVICLAVAHSNLFVVIIRELGNSVHCARAFVDSLGLAIMSTSNSQAHHLAIFSSCFFCFSKYH